MEWSTGSSGGKAWLEILPTFQPAQGLAHQVPFLIISALKSLEFGPDSFCHQCQAQSRPGEGKVCILTEGGRQEHPCRQRLVRDWGLHCGCQELGSPLGRDKTPAQPLGALTGLEGRGRPRGRPRIWDSPGVTEELTPHHLALKVPLQH